MLIDPTDSVLIVIDMQERLVPAMEAPARTIANAAKLITAAREVKVPILLTEQYPKGLGSTVEPIAKLSDSARVFPKIHFSCMNDPDFNAAFKAEKRKQAIIAGMEAHICVTQTAASLMDDGFDVFVVSDATASRTKTSEEACIARLSAAGAGIVTTEMVIFEWLGQADTPEFRRLLPLVK